MQNPSANLFELVCWYTNTQVFLVPVRVVAYHKSARTVFFWSKKTINSWLKNTYCMHLPYCKSSVFPWFREKIYCNLNSAHNLTNSWILRSVLRFASFHDHTSLVNLFTGWLEKNNPEHKDNQELAMLVIHRTLEKKMLLDNW